MTRALISVSDKTNLIAIAQVLQEMGIEIISTGGTQAYLSKNGITTIAIEEVTGFPEILDGRVKTLHPKVHGGLLALRDNRNHMQALEEHQIEKIDYIIVNLYPFKETIQDPNVNLFEAIEKIDIGGPSMLRSAAKNYESVTVISDPEDYEQVISELKEHGATCLSTRKLLAQKVFAHTASYDAAIASYLSKQLSEEQTKDSIDSDTLTLTGERLHELRYGENSHQTATVYANPQVPSYSITKAEKLNGKNLSFNNYRDADAAIKILREFSDQICAVAVKHLNPCGVAIGNTIEESFTRCYESDPVSIFGGIVAFNQPITEKLANRLHQMFLDVIIAPDFEEEALEILKQKPNVRLLRLKMDDLTMEEKEVISVSGGILVQDQDLIEEEPSEWVLMTEKDVTSIQREALQFAWKVAKHVKSNAIVVTNEYQTFGIGAGQTNRVGAAKIAIEQAEQSGFDLTNMVLASDAFIPMIDTIEYAHQHQVKAIIQPGGSINDQEVIDKANEYNISMLATNVRHFRH
ncbi:bifunctional phosphoribosylaminoimidazolecarboxamide formyltransferase/IMP cyclohydrolase [Facklamia lactis]|uniref:bifunctional phosphoribosylaminoimidazolecarboxamide formyltransferase/IMP cyclohydrolase n=1 Tax=Facklamia lactis TaxID=2749967 RepID=UPI0018CCCAB0|nr:bifunctional phosphoribosylaminoimidazolecarboxamide formyltransferase/IMP cyclohydrolase [Facklamia lactis]MBG9980001.1 bifunctional phosphoribosylaminoimidazolecarboxamide formyltransferase/IMP cyclohydrolase [Facklamia lactis]